MAKGISKKHEGRKPAPQTGLTAEEKAARIERKRAKRAAREACAVRFEGEEKAARIVAKVNAALRCKLLRQGITPNF